MYVDINESSTGTKDKKWHNYGRKKAQYQSTYNQASSHNKFPAAAGVCGIGVKITNGVTFSRLSVK